MTAGEQEPETSGPSPSDPDASPGRAVPALAEVRAEWIDFYDANYHRVMRFLIHNGASLQAAQDAAQEAFTESWALMETHPDRWLGVSAKMAWIRTVALRRYLRPPGPRTRPKLADDAVPEQTDVALGPCELTAQTQMVLQALHSLDEQARAVMAFHLDDFSTQAIAEALDLTEQRVRDVKKKARAALRITLAAQMPPRRRQPR